MVTGFWSERNALHFVGSLADMPDDPTNADRAGSSDSALFL